MKLTQNKFENLVSMLESEDQYSMALNVIKHIDKGCYYKKILKHLLMRDSVKSCGVNYVIMQSGPKIYFNTIEEAEYFCDQFLIKENKVWKKKILR